MGISCHIALRFVNDVKRHWNWSRFHWMHPKIWPERSHGSIPVFLDQNTLYNQVLIRFMHNWKVVMLFSRAARQTVLIAVYMSCSSCCTINSAHFQVLFSGVARNFHLGVTGLGTEVLQWGPGAKHRLGLWGKPKQFADTVYRFWQKKRSKLKKNSHNSPPDSWPKCFTLGTKRHFGWLCPSSPCLTPPLQLVFACVLSLSVLSLSVGNVAWYERTNERTNVLCRSVATSDYMVRSLLRVAYCCLLLDEKWYCAMSLQVPTDTGNKAKVIDDISVQWKDLVELFRTWETHFFGEKCAHFTFFHG